MAKTVFDIEANVNKLANDLRDIRNSLVEIDSQGS